MENILPFQEGINCCHKIESFLFFLLSKAFALFDWSMGILTDYGCDKTPGPGCSKLTTLLVNVSLKFQMLISEICQYFC